MLFKRGINVKKRVTYRANGKQINREYTYIPMRYIFSVLITVLEILAIIGTVIALCYFIPYFYLAAMVTQIVCVVRIISSDDNPDYKLPWLLFVLILPIAGFMLYFLFYSRKLKSKYKKRLEELKGSGYVCDDQSILLALEAESEEGYLQAVMLKSIAEGHLFSQTQTTYFSLGEEMWQAMLLDLREAKRFIYLEYFIVEQGVFFNSILEILKEKAKEGVEVKLLYDDIGCMTTLPGNYAKQLKKWGIAGASFSRLRGAADGEFNNRSHRKIMVIDGYVGYTGGVNLADEYVNLRERFGHWKDGGVRLEGKAVWELTRLFLIDFGINVKDELSTREDWYPNTLRKDDGYILPFGDGPRPMYPRRVGQSILQTMIMNAKKFVYITTPYLVVDNAMCQTLESAALRGVRVKIITPHIPDKKLVFGITRSFYPRLISAGVEIYEYESGFIHAKNCLVDGAFGLISTINLDYRSLVHHFENGVWLYKASCLEAMKRDVEDALGKCILMTEKDYKANVLQRGFRAMARIFAPLL